PFCDTPHVLEPHPGPPSAGMAADASAVDPVEVPMRCRRASSLLAEHDPSEAGAGARPREANRRAAESSIWRTRPGSRRSAPLRRRHVARHSRLDTRTFAATICTGLWTFVDDDAFVG